MARACARNVQFSGGALGSPLPELVPARIRSQTHPPAASAEDRAHGPTRPGRPPVNGKVLVTGSSGFIGGYVVEELIRRDYTVIGVDDHSKYGHVAKSYDDDPNYTLVEADVRD